MVCYEFDCADCGCPVSLFPVGTPPDGWHPTRCAGCQWLFELPELMDPAEKAELRAYMAKRGIIGTAEFRP